MADRPLKNPPPYAITSVDNALRIAAMLQLEGPLTVTEVAHRVGVAPSTAHRLLQMLVYRDFATQDESRAYRVGPLLELASHSQSDTSKLRAAALPHLQWLVDRVGESANLTVRTGDTVRFIASVESSQALRVGNREGMVFNAHETTAGLIMLAELEPEELASLYGGPVDPAYPHERPDLAQLRTDLARIRRSGFALNVGRSERGVVAIGVPIHGTDRHAIAGISVSMPSVRYDKSQLPTYVDALAEAAKRLERDLQG
ncbi:IclR family transcriptional regulator [Nocardioides sp. Kera G14]|uniref:IclR family transcriptional regulator n=1 Tax=Nocardioides sp. Kera G14 TaxID=2884264 RepID=UPI001D11FB2E|nr:IclR family transcriptional regulator [Nocardioides sp. Kera G14]UDY23385.1 IclR family transcriptional regulator [Nocardioides sp. Kera G14]